VAVPGASDALGSAGVSRCLSQRVPPIATRIRLTTTSSAPTISHENVAEVDGTAKIVVHVFAEA
jgi:hypothetical protein